MGLCHEAASGVLLYSATCDVDQSIELRIIIIIIKIEMQSRVFDGDRTGNRYNRNIVTGFCHCHWGTSFACVLLVSVSVLQRQSRD